MPSRNPESIANRLTAKERVALFCAAADIEHAALGILSSTMQLMEIRGLIARGSNAGRYQLTDSGRAVFGVLLAHAGIKPEG